MTDKNYPYGHCECPEHPDCKGPAFYSVLRDGKRIKVCTRCNLPSDTGKTLLIKDDQCIGPFYRYDALGLFAAGFEAADADRKGQ